MCQTLLTDWQSASRNFFAIQPMKMMEAEGKKSHVWSNYVCRMFFTGYVWRKTEITNTNFQYCDWRFHSPMTANISVFVKCLYRDNLTGFFLSFRVLMVCARLTKTLVAVKVNKGQTLHNRTYNLNMITRKYLFLKTPSHIPDLGGEDGLFWATLKWMTNETLRGELKWSPVV